MTSPSRETILDALFDKLKATYEFATAERRLQHWSKVSNFPALFIRHVEDQVDRPNTVLSRTTMHVQVFIYTKAGGDSRVPDASLNDLVDAVEAALAPDPGPPGRNMLGGLVQHCWIEGTTIFNPGDQDAEGRAQAMIPVLILIP